jgi:hypothetical protein
MKLNRKSKLGSIFLALFCMTFAMGNDSGGCGSGGDKYVKATSLCVEITTPVPMRLKDREVNLHVLWELYGIPRNSDDYLPITVKLTEGGLACATMPLFVSYTSDTLESDVAILEVDADMLGDSGTTMFGADLNPIVDPVDDQGLIKTHAKIMLKTDAQANAAPVQRVKRLMGKGGVAVAKAETSTDRREKQLGDSVKRYSDESSSSAIAL